MRASRSLGATASTWWSALFVLATVLSTAPSVFAKDEPTVLVTEFDNYPGIPSYFPDSNIVIFREAARPHTIWRSTDGGATWDKTKGIDTDISSSLILHDYDPDRAYVLTYDNVHWRTSDKGETWEKFYTEVAASEDTNSWLTFHADDPDKILFNVECEGLFCGDLSMYTTNGFKEKAKVLRKKTTNCQWAKSSEVFTTGDPEVDANRILCIVRPSIFSLGENRLFMSDSYFKVLDDDEVHEKLEEKEVNLSGNGPVEGIVSILAVKKYFLAATSSPRSTEMALFVTDDTKVWHRAIFPKDHPLVENSYTVLQSTNYSIQIDVLSGKGTHNPMGTLLTSNSNGTYFTRNVEHTNRDVDFHVDFEQVTGIQGVYLVNQVDNWEKIQKNEDATKKSITKITFDDGRSFEAITTEADDNIHLHSMTEQQNSGSVFSSPAPGLVMGNGNHGKYLKDYWESSLYISDDAGKTWIKGPKGPHKYEFGDQGSILLAVQDSEDVNVEDFKYSLDHGKNWKTINFPDNLTIRPWVLTTTQDSTSLKFVLTGQKGSKESPSYCLISIDFEGLHESTCKESDMEDWYARKDDDGKPGCVMGHTQKFRRRRKDAKCFINKEFSSLPEDTTRCSCTDRDFECDFNFVRDGDECKLAGQVPAPKDACQSDNPDETFMGSSGWRLIPGNQCKRTDDTQKDDKKEWKCSDQNSRPNNSTGEIDVTSKIFEGSYDFFEKHYLERGENSNSDEEAIITRPESVGGAGDIYITHDHGKSWTVPKALKEKAIWAIKTHNYVKNMAFFLTKDKEVYYTTDRGYSIDSFEAPVPLDPLSRVSPLSFHPNRPDWLIWHGQKCTDDKCYLEASFSDDRGDNWKTLKRYVDRCEFTGSEAYRFRPEAQIICSARARESNDADDNPLQLWYTNEVVKVDFNVALKHITRFALMAEFIVVATENTTENTLSALASLDGEIYAEAHFPANFKVPHANSYTVLDSSTHAVNLFVATETEETRRYGSILKSNSNGTSYVLSMSGVNANHDWFVDFEKMLGLEGVMLVNTVANQDSDSEPKNLQTRISHNDGSQWSFLPPPQKDVENKPYSCSSREGDAICALHLHGYTERVDRGSAYSSESAVGLMFGLGNVGPILGDAKDADTFMTQDAGLTWKEVKKGTWAWSFGDQGSLIVLAERNVKTKSISYSLDRGDSWQDYEFSDSEVTITDVTTLRSGASRNFLLWGHTGKDLITFNLDFSGLTDRPCVHDEDDLDKSDYELWSPGHPDRPDGCLFGHKNWYLRKKKDRTCYNERQLQSVYDFKTCECTREDYECDYNYELVDHMYCALVDGLQPKDPEEVCREDPDLMEYPERSALRRIPLTTCRGGKFDPENLYKYHPCPGHEEEFEKKRGVSGVAIFFAVVIPIAIAAVAGWWVYSNWQSKFGQIRLGEQSSLDNDAPWVKYPVIAVSAVVAVVGALPLVASSVWRTVSASISKLRGRGDSGGRYSWLRSNGQRRFTTRDSFARGRGDYAIVDDDEGELLGDDSDDEA